MSKRTKPLGSLVREWVTNGFFYDRLFALRERTLAAFQQLIYRFGRAKKSKPRKTKPSYHPIAERLETREMMSVSTWTGGGSDDYWSNSDNWDNGVPSGTDMAVIEGASDNVVLDGSVSIYEFQMSDGTLSGPYTLNVQMTNSSFWSGGTITGGTELRLTGGVIFEIGGNVLLDNATLYNDAELNWTAGNITLDNDAVIENDGTFDIQSDAQILDGGNGANLLENTGTIQKTTATGNTDIQVSVNNSGTVDEQSGHLRFPAGDFTFVGVGGAVLGVTFSGATIVSPSESIGYASDITISGGSIVGDGDIRLSGDSTWSAGGMVDLGQLIVLGGATLQITHSSNWAIDEHTFINYGITTWSGSGTLTLSNNAQLINAVGNGGIGSSMASFA